MKDTEGRMMQTFRIAIRYEGQSINAYWARIDTMEGAIPIASFNRRICDTDPKIFNAWVALLKVSAEVVSRDVFGEGVAEFTEERVPTEDHDK